MLLVTVTYVPLFHTRGACDFPEGTDCAKEIGSWEINRRKNECHLCQNNQNNMNRDLLFRPFEESLTLFAKSSRFGSQQRFASRETRIVLGGSRAGAPAQDFFDQLYL